MFLYTEPRTHTHSHMHAHAQADAEQRCRCVALTGAGNLCAPCAREVHAQHSGQTPPQSPQCRVAMRITCALFDATATRCSRAREHAAVIARGFALIASPSRTGAARSKAWPFRLARRRSQRRYMQTIRRRRPGINATSSSYRIMVGSLSWASACACSWRCDRCVEH